MGRCDQRRFIDLRSQVNKTADRRLLDIAIHPDFSAANPRRCWQQSSYSWHKQKQFQMLLNSSMNDKKTLTLALAPWARGSEFRLPSPSGEGLGFDVSAQQNGMRTNHCFIQQCPISLPLWIAPLTLAKSPLGFCPMAPTCKIS